LLRRYDIWDGTRADA
jgi:hypothetical protein